MCTPLYAENSNRTLVRHKILKVMWKIFGVTYAECTLAVLQQHCYLVNFFFMSLDFKFEIGLKIQDRQMIAKHAFLG